MRIAIVTPYYKESENLLERCIDSVSNQTISCDHIMVADGHASSFAKAKAKHHIELPASNGDCGDTPRMIGAAFAFTQGYDALC